MRQDMEFLPGEIVTSSIIARLFSMVGATKIISVDIHSKLALNYFDIPIKNISAVSKLALYFKKMRLKNPLVVAPDLFWSNQAKEFATILGTKSIAMNKQRNRKTGKIYIKATKKMDLMQRDIVLIDDMISTGDSVIKATEYLKDQNCGNVYAACTHALLVDDAEKKIKRAGIKKIISTNTIPNKNSIIDVSDIITHAI
jgi:ribose-phosphate pyrophosphokinase